MNHQSSSKNQWIKALQSFLSHNVSSSSAARHHQKIPSLSNLVLFSIREKNPHILKCLMAKSSSTTPGETLSESALRSSLSLLSSSVANSRKSKPSSSSFFFAKSEEMLDFAFWTLARVPPLLLVNFNNLSSSEIMSKYSRFFAIHYQNLFSSSNGKYHHNIQELKFLFARLRAQGLVETDPFNIILYNLIASQGNIGLDHSRKIEAEAVRLYETVPENHRSGIMRESFRNLMKVIAKRKQQKIVPSSSSSSSSSFSCLTAETKREIEDRLSITKKNNFSTSSSLPPRHELVILDTNVLIMLLNLQNRTIVPFEEKKNNNNNNNQRQELLITAEKFFSDFVTKYDRHQQQKQDHQQFQKQNSIVIVPAIVRHEALAFFQRRRRRRDDDVDHDTRNKHHRQEEEKIALQRMEELRTKFNFLFLKEQDETAVRVKIDKEMSMKESNNKGSSKNKNANDVNDSLILNLAKMIQREVFCSRIIMYPQNVEEEKAEEEEVQVVLATMDRELKFKVKQRVGWKEIVFWP